MVSEAHDLSSCSSISFSDEEAKICLMVDHESNWSNVSSVGEEIKAKLNQVESLIGFQNFLEKINSFLK